MSKDIKMFVICNHLVSDVLYEEGKCPRCYGKGVYFDIYFDVLGKPVLSESTPKLQQELLKVIIENKGKNPFHLAWGSELNERVVGSKNNPANAMRIELIVRQALEHLRDVQEMNQNEHGNMDDEEIISTIDSIVVSRLGVDGYQVDVTVTSKVGDIIEYSVRL